MGREKFTLDKSEIGGDIISANKTNTENRADMRYFCFYIAIILIVARKLKRWVSVKTQVHYWCALPS